MLADLAAAVDLDIPVDGDSLVEALALRDQLDARIAVATGVFEANGCWAGDASVSFCAWLRAQAKMTRRSAQRLRNLAVRLRALPMCAQAYAEGWLSGGQIEAIVARLDDDVVEIFAAQEAELVPYLIPMTVAGVSRAMGYWLARNRPEPTEPKVRSARCTSRAPSTTAGFSMARSMLKVAPSWRPRCGWPLRTGPTWWRPRPPGGRTPSSTSAGSSSITSRPTPAVVTARTSTWWSSSRTWRPAAAATSSTGRRSTVPPSPGCSATAPCTGWSCRAVRPSSTTAPQPGPSPLRCGTPWSSVTSTAASRAVTGPRCGARATHVVWVTQGGPTELANLVLLCARHHHVLHQPGWHAKLRPDGTFEVTDAGGIVRETSPPRAEMPW